MVDHQEFLQFVEDENIDIKYDDIDSFFSTYPDPFVIYDRNKTIIIVFDATDDIVSYLNSLDVNTIYVITDRCTYIEENVPHVIATDLNASKVSRSLHGLRRIYKRMVGDERDKYAFSKKDAFLSVTDKSYYLLELKDGVRLLYYYMLPEKVNKRSISKFFTEINTIKCTYLYIIVDSKGVAIIDKYETFFNNYCSYKFVYYNIDVLCYDVCSNFLVPEIIVEQQQERFSKDELPKLLCTKDQQILQLGLNKFDPFMDLIVKVNSDLISYKHCF